MFVEYKRESGKSCFKTKFDSPDEETTAPEYCPVGTGFAMKICGQALFFSNRHVLSAAATLPLFVRMKTRPGDFVHLRISDWLGHPDPMIDVAASHLELPDKIKESELSFSAFNEDTDRQAKEPQSFFLSLNDLEVGDSVLLVGYPASIPNVFEILQRRDAPIFRGGVISQILPGVTRLKTQEGIQEFKDIFFIDAWAFGGNSGSPVFLLPVPLRYKADRPKLKLNRPYIIGIQGAVIPNTGLTIVYGADGIETTAAQFPGAKCPAPLKRQPKD